MILKLFLNYNMFRKNFKNFFTKISEFCLNLFFPRVCINCQREGNWLCDDCLATLEIQSNVFCPICLRRTLDFKTCRNCKNKTNLSGLLWALPYQNFLVKKLIHQFKYEPFIKELKQPLSYIIISHLLLTEFFSSNRAQEFILIPIPLSKKRLRWRGFDQAEELSKEISNYFKMPILNNVLIRERETLPQVDLEGKDRKENIKGAFFCQKPDLIRGRKIFLIDDVYTTGTTMEEAAKILKEAGAKEVWGMVVARG